MNETRAAYDNGDGLAERIAYLIAGFIRGTLTEPEHNELDRWVEASDANVRLFEELTDESNIEAGQLWFQRRQAQQEANAATLQAIKQKAGLRHKTPFYRLFWPYAVAVVVLLIVGGILWESLFTPNNEKPTIAAQQKSVPHTPAGVLLTLSDGRTLVLDSMAKGSLADGARVRSAGTLVYDATGGSGEKYNTLSVPRGAQYQVVLPDGTTVWLNAESSLRYPVAFTGNNRAVTLTGEGYFEVAEDASKPFRVQTGSQVVTVLGTRFNINGYGGDSTIQTTLLEGLVQVEQGQRSRILKPGQQAQTNAAGIGVRNVDAREAVAWKEGLFLFRNASIETVAGQLKHWYGVEVVYQGTVRGHFNATISRTESLPRLLSILEGSGFVQFRLQDNKLVIRP